MAINKFFSRLRTWFAAVAIGCWITTAGAADTVTIGLISDGPSERFYIPLELLEQEISVVLGREYQARLPASKQVYGNWQLESIEQALIGLLRDPAVDVVIATGLIATHVAAHLPSLSKPVIGVAVADATLQKFPLKDGHSGKSNFVYLADDRTVGADLELFHRLSEFKHLGILADRAIFQALPELPTLISGVEERLGIEISLIEVNDQAAAAVAGLAASIDAVFVPPLLRFSKQELQHLAAELQRRQIASFTLVSQPYLDLGFLMTGAGRGVDLNRAARRIALNVQSIVLGVDAGELKVALRQPQKLAINMATAKAIGYSPRWQDLEGAIVINDGQEQGPASFSLVSAIEHSLANNLSLKVAEFAPLIAKTDVTSSRSALLPQLGARVTASQIDRDRANPQFQAERSGQAIGEASQVVYSETAWSGFHIARYLAEAEDHGLKIAVYDTIEATAQAYLALLQAQAQTAVRRSNVSVTEKNLELAQSRTRIGQSGRTDVLRFVSELAIDRQNYYQARANSDAASVELKRVLNLPQTEPLNIDDAGIPGLLNVLADQRFQKFFNSQAKWQVFRQFALAQSIDNAPELKRNEALIAGADRRVTATERAYYVPDVSIVGQSATRWLRGGRGASLAGTGRDQDEWSVGVEASLPLFRGGALNAERSQARYQLTRSQIQQAELKNDVQARVLSALERAGGSYPAIRLSAEAAKAAADNLAVVTDAYSAGAASITELNDAQDAALTARLATAQARYQFMSDLVAVQRGMADFNILLSAEGLESWHQQVEEYFRNHGELEQ